MVTAPSLLEIEHVRRRWGWLLALGIVMVVLGGFALAMAPVTTVAAVMLLGWLMVFSGVMEFIHAFHVRGWVGVFLHLIGGALGVLIGLLVVTHPLAGALAWTLLFAAIFTVIGVLRIVASARLRFPGWGWALLDGVVTLGLGVILWAQWPWSGLWFLGLSVGISLLLRGWTYLMFAVGVRSLLHHREEVRRAA